MLACLYVCILCMCVHVCVYTSGSILECHLQECLLPPLTQCLSLARSSPVGSTDWAVNTKDPTVSIRLFRAGLKTLIYLLGILVWVVTEL